jgi:hypothetical protein
LLPPDDDKTTDEDLDDDEDALPKDQITLEEVSSPRVVIYSENWRADDDEDQVKELVLDIPYVVGAGESQPGQLCPEHQNKAMTREAF